MYIHPFIYRPCDVSTDGSNKRMPFVDGDRTVTFRYVNKQVKHVTIEGSFPKPMSMVGKDGAWVYRTAPLPSEMYTYRFAIGGKKMVTDPLNPNVVCDIDDSLSYFVVGGYPGSYYMDNNVPHGTVLHLFVNVTESNRPVTVHKRHTFV